jgi:hypothetical protein
LLWRALGSYTESGTWKAPVSFIEAQTLPKEMLDTFFKLDDVISRMEKQYMKKVAKKKK